jgi:FtsP/CotA-like multicopper oxidase with cupredoxin domain
MKHTIALIATAAVAALAASTLKAPQWEPIDPGALGRFARDTTHAHQLDSVAHVQIQAGQVIRQNALQNLGDDIHYTQGDSVDLGRGIIKRSSLERSQKAAP